jgi:ATP-binding cassette, subfamily B, bacterial
MVAEPIEHFRQQLQELQRAEASIVRVRELFEIKPELPDGALEMTGGALLFQLERVSFAYEDDVRVLEDVSFRLEPGSVLGLLGRTGSGKTTLARMLFRFYDAQSGSVRIGGHDVREYNLNSLRSRVALVTQDVQLFQASLRDNLTFFDASINDDRLTHALTQLGLGDWLEGLPEGLSTPLATGSLSAGESQLVALARAFLHDPGLVILDEASARLDPATEARLERALDTLLAGRTAIIIAHRLRTVERATHILVLESGRVLEFGERQSLARNANSRFSELRRVGLEEVLA